MTDSFLLHHVRELGRGRATQEGFRSVYDTYYDSVRRFFRRLGHDVEEARDLTQDTFLRVYQGRGVFETSKDFKAWLFRIALNVHLNALRARHSAKRNAAEKSLDQWIEEHGSPPPAPSEGPNASPLDDALDHERMVVLGVAVKKLPPQMRRCCLLHFRHGWSYREIADVLRISEGTVKAHVFQARSKLDSLMAPYLERPEPGSLGKVEE